MQIAIVDDSLADIKYLYDNIHRYCQKHKVHMIVEQFNDCLLYTSFPFLRHPRIFSRSTYRNYVFFLVLNDNESIY